MPRILMIVPGEIVYFYMINIKKKYLEGIEIHLKKNKLLFTLPNTFVKYQYKPLEMID